MLHPWPMISGYVDEPLDGDRGADHRRCGARSSTRPTARAASCAATRCSSPAASARPTRRSPAPRPAGCRGARTIIAPIASCSTHRVGIGVACEDLPEEHNRVTLDPVLKDSHGIPAPRIDYTISENTQPHDGPRHRPGRGDPDGRRRHAASHCSRTALNSAGPPAGHGAHGHRSRALGGERMGPLPRREEPVHRRRQHLGHRRRREPDLDHPGAGALHRRQIKQRLATLFD